MSSNYAIELKRIEKNYKVYKKPIERLLQMLPWNKGKKLYDDFFALKNISLEVKKGEVVGIVGQNGAGKSTLLQIVCKTLQPSGGELRVNGRIAALLELGSGFNPEFTGRENIYMAGAIAGLSKEQIDQKYDSIVNFAGIGHHIDNPVKTYSSGMGVRLAFSVATSVQPDILVIDEALSVGDGAFARKSFDRIMKLKDAGCTILFCSHSLYQVEVLCDRVAWIDRGEVKSFGSPSLVIGEYQKFLDNLENPLEIETENREKVQEAEVLRKKTVNSAKIKKVVLSSDGGEGKDLNLVSDISTLRVEAVIQSDPELPVPSAAVIITDEAGRNITSCGSFYDGVKIELDGNGEAKVQVEFEKIGLRRGKYYVYFFLLCEKAIHIYESVQCGTLHMTQRGAEIGVVSIPRVWK